MTVRQLMAQLGAAKNLDMIVVVCDQGVPYREVTRAKDETGAVVLAEVGQIDGVFLLFADDPQ